MQNRSGTNAIMSPVSSIIDILSRPEINVLEIQNVIKLVFEEDNSLDVSHLKEIISALERKNITVIAKYYTEDIHCLHTSDDSSIDDSSTGGWNFTQYRYRNRRIFARTAGTSHIVDQYNSCMRSIAIYSIIATTMKRSLINIAYKNAIFAALNMPIQPLSGIESIKRYAAMVKDQEMYAAELAPLVTAMKRPPPNFLPWMLAPVEHHRTLSALYYAENEDIGQIDPEAVILRDSLAS